MAAVRTKVRRDSANAAINPSKVVAKAAPTLTLADIVQLLCEYAKKKNIEEHQGDGRHEGNASHGINALSARAASEGVTIGPTAIKGLLDPVSPTQNPRMGTTLKPIAQLLELWNVRHPKTDERITYSAKELQKLHKSTHHNLLGRDVRLRIDIKKLVDAATEKQLIVVYAFLNGQTQAILSGDLMADQKRRFISENGSKDDLERLFNHEDSTYVAARLHMILLQDKVHMAIHDNHEYVRSLLDDSTIDLTLISTDEIDLKVDELAAVATSIESNTLPSDEVESVKDLIVLLALYAEKPYDEKEENKVPQFLTWIGLPSV
jgi:hypothetical protein